MITCHSTIWLTINYHERLTFVCHCGVVSIWARVSGKIETAFVLVPYYTESTEAEFGTGTCNRLINAI